MIGSRTPDHAIQRALKHQWFSGLCSRMQQCYCVPISHMVHPVTQWLVAV